MHGMKKVKTIYILRWAGWLAVLLWASWILYQATHLPSTPSLPEAAQEPQGLAGPGSDDVPEDMWDVFIDTSASARPSAGAGEEGRYRLAGTFISFPSGSGQNEVRKAILDDAGAKSQILVQQGDDLGTYVVEHIQRDMVTLRKDSGKKVELRLSFTSGGPAETEKGPGILEPTSFEEMPALESSRFGKRIAENRWVLSRDALMGYYEELLDHPERMAALFSSMEDLEEDSVLAGYQVNIKGEEDLFSAMGLKQGDIVREVNSIRMTSPRRSEYLIKEFVQGRLNAVVFDVEREGERQKLIELIR